MAVAAASLAVSSVPVAVSATSSPTTPGVTPTSITIGATVPLSGFEVKAAAASAAAAAVFKYVDAKGGVNGRRINYVRIDDCINLAAYGLGCSLPIAATTVSQTKAMMTSGVFATVGSVGTGAQESVLSYLNTNKVPQLFVNSGSTDWNQPAKYPQTFGFATSFKAEGKIYAKYITTHYAGLKVGFIGAQNTLGTTTFDTIGTALFSGLTTKTGVTVAKSDHRMYTPFDALGGANDIVPSIAQLQSDAVKVVVLASTPAVTSSILAAAHAAGYNPHWFIASNGSDPVQVDSPYEVGAITLTSFPSTSDATNAWNVWLRKVLASDHSDVPSYRATSPLDPQWQYGAAYAVSFLEALRVAGKTPTRASFLAALTKTMFQSPAVLALHYSASSHQGLNGGVLAAVAARPVDSLSIPSPIMYSTSGVAGAPVLMNPHYGVSAIPTWLK